jgi:hypothetical protein
LALLEQAVDAYTRALELQQAQSGSEGEGESAHTLLKRGRACSDAAAAATAAERGQRQAHQRRSRRDFKRVVKLDPANEAPAGLQQQALGALALDALNRGKIGRGVELAGRALAGGNRHALAMLRDVDARARQRDDAAMVAQVEAVVRAAGGAAGAGKVGGRSGEL